MVDPFPELGPRWDRDGNPMTFLGWGKLLEDDDYRVVRRTTIGEEEAIVSTVWVGIGLTLGASPPHIFETAIFAERLACNDDRYRAPSEAEALVAHTLLVHRALEELGVPFMAASEIAVYATVHDAGQIVVSPATGKLLSWVPLDREALRRGELRRS